MGAPVEEVEVPVPLAGTRQERARAVMEALAGPEPNQISLGRRSPMPQEAAGLMVASERRVRVVLAEAVPEAQQGYLTLKAD